MNMPRNQTGAGESAEAGFTLIEFLVALTIVGIVIGAIGTTIARRETRPSPAETAKAMQSMLFRARSNAILKGADTIFGIDTGARRYIYPVGSTPAELPEGQEIRMIAGGELISGTTYHLLFRADGSSSGAEILLTDGQRADARIEVNWLTGIPRVFVGQSQ